MKTNVDIIIEEAYKRGRKAGREEATRELAPCKSAGPVPVVAAVATGSLPVSRAAVFEELNQMATDYEDIGQERTADTIRAVAEMYRRHAACTIPRQPEENKTVSRDAGADGAPKPLNG